MPIDDSRAQRALDKLLVLLPTATAIVSLEMARDVRSEARAYLKDPLGPLAESIHTTGPDRVGTNAFRTRVGPTLVYGRQRELGGHIDAGILTAHYRDPGYWTWNGSDVFTQHVFQVGQHYLKRGVETSLPRLLRTAQKIWGDTIRMAF